MSDVAIRVANLGKRYQIARSQTRGHYKTLQEDLLALPRRLVAAAHGNGSAHETFWALRDVSFEVKQGEVLGVIGRNGAGKSTLLKILANITEPTTGRAEIYGRVGSLLEVGTGFHQELTGRENIYLSGAILGMTHREVQRKFDEIVAFAGVEKFIDTPAKHYSSGMYMRLAFAVAAHLEPEILLVDEVLAVGDAEFQKKCLGKMGEVATEGRTVLFVSHQMNAVQALCRSCLLLANGRIIASGPPDRVINGYLNDGLSGSEWTASAETQLSNPYFRPTRFAVIDRHQAALTREIGADEEFGILIEGIVEVVDQALTVGFALFSASGELLFWSLHTDTQPEQWPRIHTGLNKLICWMPEHLLNEGQYRIDLILSLHYTTWLSQPSVNAPSVQFGIRGGLSQSPYWMMARPGLLALLLPFSSTD